MAKGRKRKIGPREPNGRVRRPVQADIERDATHVAKEARKRVLGAPEAIVAHVELGSAIGRMLKAGSLGKEDGIGRTRYSAALTYQRRHARYLAAIDAPERVIEPRSEADPPKPCETCGLTIRCEPCQAEFAEDAKAGWAELEGLLTIYERAVMRTVVLLDYDQRLSADVIVRCLDRLNEHFAARAKGRVAA